MRASLIALLFLTGACSGDDDGGLDPDATELSFETGDFEIPVGDSFTCFYTDTFSPRELSVNSAFATQHLGGHHVVVYYAETPRAPGYHPCTDEEMTNLHQIAAAGGIGTQEPPLELRDNLALKVPAGKQFVLQAHYINATDAPRIVNDRASIRLMKPEDVRAYVNYFVTNDTAFEIPAQANYAHTTSCTVERDLDIVLTLGHMHEDGRQYNLEIVDETDTVVQELRNDVWQPSFTSHPPLTHYPADAPLRIAAGTRLRQTCEWDNPSDRLMIFPREMCLSFMYYFPGDGDDIICDMAER